MTKKKVKNYTAEFKESAVKLAVGSDKPVTETARELGVNINTLHTWITKFQRPKVANQLRKNDEHPYDEVKRLRKELKSLKEEHAILKKAAAFFARESL
jgi:transposase